MENVKRVPYGVSDFVKVVERNQYYVDKTMYLPLLEDEADNLFFIRPRRFGKSLFISMLRAYYDIKRKDKFDKLFGNLWISLPTIYRRDIIFAHAVNIVFCNHHASLLIHL